VTYRIKPNLPVVGKRYGKLIPAIRAALALSDGSAIAKLAARGEVLNLDVEGQTIELAPDALLIESSSAEGFACAEDAGYLVGLDTTLTDELVREGLAREIVRTVQDARKQAGLDVSDRIVLNIDGNEPVIDALSVHREYIAGEALVNGWEQLSSPPAFSTEHSLGAASWRIRLARERTPA
jgi:isoleucyl-tRNA synthetase